MIILSFFNGSSDIAIWAWEHDEQPHSFYYEQESKEYDESSNESCMEKEVVNKLMNGSAVYYGK